LDRVAEAGGEDSTEDILSATLCWHEETYGWTNPDYYGEALQRLVVCADIAIWLPWRRAIREFIQET
jgi:hypothetical protein